MDGRSRFQAFRYVIMRGIRQGVISVRLFSFLPTYNDFAVAAVVSTTAPLYILMMFFQRQSVSGLTAGAVKG